MKQKKQTIETTMESLYGEDYKIHIEIGKKFWVLFPKNHPVAMLTHQCEHIIKMTFYRSEHWFYKVVGFDEVPEQCFHEDSLLPQLMYPTELNPKKDIPKFANRKYAEQKYRFNDRHTNIIDWDNSEYTDTDIDLSSIFYLKK